MYFYSVRRVKPPDYPQHDPIIEEIHRIREKYAEKFGFDLDAMFADLKLKEKQSNRRKVTRKANIFKKKALAHA